MGHFVIESEERLSEDAIYSLYQVNALAIIFPYLRALVSDLSSKGMRL
ncbi:hypothetical protein ACI2OX_19200 [Bacillus sp. N9]